MAIPTLESLTAKLNATVVGLLGDTIDYRVGGGASANLIMAFVDHAEGVRNFGDTAAIHQDVMVSVRMTDIPVRPADADRIRLLKVPSAMFKPIAVERDESGTFWVFHLKEVKS